MTSSGADKAPEEVTVPISGEQNSIDVAVTVDGTKATISEVDMSDLGAVIGDKVSTGAYYEDAVNWAVANGITNGTSDTTFSPNADCVRAQIVTFLYRAAK